MAAANNAGSDRHTHSDLLMAGADAPDAKASEFLLVFGGNRIVRGIVGPQGLTLEEHPDDKYCPDKPIGNSAPTIPMYEDNPTECAFRKKAVTVMASLADHMGDHAVADTIRNSKVVVSPGKIGATKTRIEQFDWVYEQLVGWKASSINGLPDISGMMWGPLGPHEKMLGDLIPQPIPGYLEHPGLVRKLDYVAFVSDSKIIGVKGLAGGGKTSGVLHWAATRGAPVMGPIGIERDTTSDMLILSDRIVNGNTTVGLGPVPKYLAVPAVVLADEMAAMEDVTCLLPVLDGKPGTKVPLYKTQQDEPVWFERDPRSVFAWTGNQGAKHLTSDMGFAFARRSLIVLLNFDDDQFSKAASAQLEASFKAMTQVNGVDFDVIKQSARTALDEVWGPMFNRFRSDPEMIGLFDLSPFLAATLAKETPFLGYLDAFEGLLAKINDPDSRQQVVEQVKSPTYGDTWAEQFRNYHLSHADV